MRVRKLVNYILQPRVTLYLAVNAYGQRYILGFDVKRMLNNRLVQNSIVVCINAVIDCRRIGDIRIRMHHDAISDIVGGEIRYAISSCNYIACVYANCILTILTRCNYLLSL